MQPDPNLQASPEVSAETEGQSVNAGEEVTTSGIPPGIRRSNEAFYRDLPELLKNKKLFRRWVAYHGDERIGIARDPGVLYEECERRGLKQEEFAVCCIIPKMDDGESIVFMPE